MTAAQRRLSRAWTPFPVHGAPLDVVALGPTGVRKALRGSFFLHPLGTPRFRMLLTLHVPGLATSGFAHPPGGGPGAVRTVEIPGGRAHLFHPGPGELAVLAEPDTAGLPFPEYAAYPSAGFLAEAVGELLPAALAGAGDEPRPVEVRLPVLTSADGVIAFPRAFESLGYEIAFTPLPLDPRQPQARGTWLYSLVLRGGQRPREVASHLHVLLHLFEMAGVQPRDPAAMWEEGRSWMESHPKLALLERRVLRRSPGPQFHERRHDTVVTALKESGARRVLDLGCGTGALLRRLLEETQFTEVVGVEVDRRALARAAVDLPPGGRGRVLHGSLAYRDARLAGFDAAAVVEVIEHLDPPQLSAFEDALWARARPGTIVLTTPNADYNTLFEYHRGGRLRHPDHRFEWTRAEFQAWAERIAARHGYTVRFGGAGPEAPDVGALTQLAVFERLPSAAAGTVQGGDCGALRLEEVAGQPMISTLLGPVHVTEDETAVALEAISRSALDPRWLVYLPPTTPVAETPPGAQAREHPSVALAYYRARGMARVALETLHRGTRVVVVVCRDADAARRRFGAARGETGAMYGAGGRPYFATRAAEEALLARVRAAVEAGGVWEELATEWVAVEGVIGPGILVSGEVNARQGPALASWWGAAVTDTTTLTAAEAALAQVVAEWADAEALLSRVRERAVAVRAYEAAVQRLCEPVHALDELRFAPTRLLASEGVVHAVRNPRWRLEAFGAALEDTGEEVVDLADPAADARAEAWWKAALARGCTGIVVCALDGGGGMAAPAIKCRGDEALLLVHGPRHALPAERERARGRGLEEGARAAREWALSLEALERFVRREPLAAVHACVFAALGVKQGGRP